MKKFLLFFVFIYLTQSVFSQPVNFNRRYDFSFDDKSNNILEKNGEYYSLMTSRDSALSNNYIRFCKTDSIGNIIINKSYTLSNSAYTGIKLSPTKDGGFIAMEYHKTLIKFDSNGDTL